MSDASPRPWRLTGQTIRDAEGGVVMSAINPADMETRRLIVEAVNEHVARHRMIDVETLDHVASERDRLRDLVRRLADALDTFPAIEDHEIDLLREAREALEEGDRPCHG